MEKSGNTGAGPKEWSLGILLVCLLLLIPSGILLESLFPDSTENVYSYDLAVILQELLLWLLPALLLRPWRMRRLGSRAQVPRLAAAAFPLGMLVQLGASALHTVLKLPAGTEQILLPHTPAAWVTTVLALVVCPAVCEEAFFRGCLTVYLHDAAGARTALLLGTVMFAMMHGSPTGLPSQLWIGLLCTLLMLCTGRVWTAMLAHGGYNAMALLMAYVPLPVWLGAAGVIPLACCVMLSRGLRREKEKKMTGQELALTAVLLVLMLLRYLM